MNHHFEPRVARNRAGLIQLADLGVEQIRRGRDPVTVATELDAHALERSGPRAVVTEDGIRSEDWRFLLAAGSRDPLDIVSGAVFFDPTSTDTILITPVLDGDLQLKQGTVDVEELLGKSSDLHDALLAGCVGSLDAAYDQLRKEVSSWLVGQSLLAIMRALERHGDGAMNSDWEAVIERRPDLVWATLAQRGCIQPWAGG